MKEHTIALLRLQYENTILLATKTARRQVDFADYLCLVAGTLAAAADGL